MIKYFRQVLTKTEFSWLVLIEVPNKKKHTKFRPEGTETFSMFGRTDTPRPVDPFRNLAKDLKINKLLLGNNRCLFWDIQKIFAIASFWAEFMKF